MSTELHEPCIFVTEPASKKNIRLIEAGYNNVSKNHFCLKQSLLSFRQQSEFASPSVVVDKTNNGVEYLV